MIILTIEQDTLLSTTPYQSEQTFLSYFPESYRYHLQRLLTYPEYTDALSHGLGYLTLAIWDDEGGGTYLVFDKSLAQSNNVLRQLME